MPIPVEVYDFGEDMALVYEWCTNRVIQNIAKYFPYIHLDDGPLGSFEWQAKKLVEFGQCNEEVMRIIRDSLEGVPEELARTLEEQITRAVEHIEPELVGAAKAGFLPGAGVQPMSQSIRQSFTAYYEQAANKLNLVNTVMLDSTQQAYTGVVSDVVAKIANTQRYLNDATGSVVTGVETINTAMRQAINRMVENGITGFVDHAGRHWTPEAYVQMDIRTTVANAARQAAFDRCDEFGSDIIQIDAHAGARPLCYPWQGKLISRSDNARDVEDINGNKAHVYRLSDTSYGNPAGLFGVNCRHFGTPFIPGFSGLMNKDLIQPKEENDERYQLTQEQRYMERQIRDARLKESVAKTRGDAEESAKWHAKVREMSDKIGDFCEANGLPRRRDREYTPVKATWPGKTGPLSYNVQPFAGNAGNSNAMNPLQFVAQQATQTPPDVVQSNVGDTFTPAKTLAEAQKYAEKFGDFVTYNGAMTLDIANTVNRELEALTTRYPIDKFEEIKQNGRIKAIAQANFRTLEINAKKINDPMQAYSERQKQAQDALDRIAKMSAEDQRRNQKTKNLCEIVLQCSRFDVSDPNNIIGSTIAHEYGHVLADQYFGQLNGTRANSNANSAACIAAQNLVRDTYKKAMANGDAFNLSEYSTTDEYEFLAESFAASWIGETLPDYIEEMIKAVFGGGKL